jgi:type III restriction enzyme
MLEGRDGEIKALETEGQMPQRVIGDLMGMKNVLVTNDEAHHCYRQKAGEPAEREIGADEREEAKANAKAARLWISGLETVKRHIGISRILDPNPLNLTCIDLTWRHCSQVLNSAYSP